MILEVGVDLIEGNIEFWNHFRQPNLEYHRTDFIAHHWTDLFDQISYRGQKLKMVNEQSTFAHEAEVAD